MPVRNGNFGVRSSEDEFYRMKDYAFDNGRFIEGYAHPYNNCEFDSLQIIFREKVDRIDEDGVRYLSATGMDTHISGMAVWELRSRGFDLTPSDSGYAEKRYCFSDAKTGRGPVVINMVNADVIPSYRRDEIIRMQVAFFPEWLSYYESEEDIERDVRKNPDNGIRMERELGEVTAVGLRFGRSRQQKKDVDTDLWDAVTDVKAVVTKVSCETAEISEVTKGEFIRCTVDTEFGPLEIVHRIDMVEEEERSKIREGCIVYATGIISADPAIDEYEKGIVRDEVNNFRLLCDVFEGGNPDRLRAVLAEDAVYESAFSEDRLEGPDAITDRIKFVQKEGSRYYAEMGTVIRIEDGEGELPAEEGDRCIVLSAKQRKNYESVAFIRMNSKGWITGIITCADPGIHFRTDQPLDDIPLSCEYDPDGIPMILPFAGIGMDRYFAFGYELYRYMEEGTKTGKLAWSYDHQSAYDVRHEDDICYVTEYDVNHEEKCFELRGTVPLGNSDRSVWDALIAMPPMESGQEYRKRFIVLRRKEDGKGIAVLNLVEAGLYPSYMEDEEIQVRVTAFPEKMEYFGTKEELMDTLRNEDGEPMGFITDGVVFPVAFFRAHDAEHRYERNFQDDNVNLIRGIVTEILPGRIPTIYGNEAAFLRCYIETGFGEMEILHTEDMIPEGQRQNMKPGAIVYGVFRLYGNPAFGEYEYGIIANEENNLRKLREVLVTGAAEELNEILEEDAELAFDGEEDPGVKGREEVIQYLKDAYELTETCSAADMAIVDRVDVDGHQTMLPGRRCIAFAEAAGGEYTSVWFIDINERGDIVRITCGLGNGYGLRIDPRPVFRRDDGFEEETKGVH